jgi:hypothetical protein
MLEWNLQSRAHVCQLTGRSFADGETYHTVLLDTKLGFERLDLSAAAWREHQGEIAGRPNFVSHWVGTYAAPPPAPPEAIRKDDADSLLRQLLARKDERHAPAAFILAVMLERKRVVKMKSQVREEGGRWLVYEHARSGDVFTIRDPDLQLAQLETVQHDVARLLEHGLPGEPAPIEEPFNAPSQLTTLAPA